MFNAYSITQVKLVIYLLNRGLSPKRTIAKVDKI